MKVLMLLLAAALVTLTSCSSTSSPPPPVGSGEVSYKEGVPGGLLVQTVKLTASVAAIDQDKRIVTLQRFDGKKFPVEMGPGVANFDQIRVGDRLTATVTQKVAVSMDNNQAASAEGVRITAKVIAIDAEKRTATLRFEDGTIETVPVRADLDLSRHKVGEQVFFDVTEMIALGVEKQP
jgi:hypothetical protein